MHSFHKIKHPLSEHTFVNTYFKRNQPGLLPRIKRKASNAPSPVSPQIRPEPQQLGTVRAASPLSMPDSLAGSLAGSLPQADPASGDAAQTLIGFKAQAGGVPAPKRARPAAHSPHSLPGDGDTVSVGGSSAFSASAALPTSRALGNTETAALAGALDLARVQARAGGSSQHLVGEARLLSEYLADSRSATATAPHARHLARSALHSPHQSGGGHDRGVRHGGSKRSAHDAFDAGSSAAEHLAQLSSEGLNLAVEAAAAASSVSALLPQVLQQSVRGDVTGALHALGSSLQSVVGRQARMTAHMLHLQRAAVSVLHYARAAVSHPSTKATSSSSATPSAPPGDARVDSRPPSPPASTLSGRTLQPQGTSAGWHINTSTAVSDVEGGLHDMSPLPGPALGALPSVGSASVDGAAEAATGVHHTHPAAIHDSPNFKALFTAVDKVTSSQGGNAEN